MAAIGLGWDEDPSPILLGCDSGLRELGKEYVNCSRATPKRGEDPLPPPRGGGGIFEAER